jgi:CubicO group peptidase (beta-lactamase class C family)
VAHFVDEHGLDGAGLIVVEREDGVVYEGYWGSFSADRVSLVASSTKMVTAGVLMHLADEGLLDIDAPVAEAVEWGAGNPEITPAQLVSNSSGLVGLAPRPGYAPYRCQWDAGDDLQRCAAEIFTTPDDDADVIAPDTEFRYGGGQWQVAGGLAEAVSGMSWAELIDEIYVRPCGLESTGYNNHWAQYGSVGFEYPDAFAADPSTLRPTANPNMEGGMYTTTGDYAKLLLMHLRDGRCGDEQVLSPGALQRVHADRIGEVYGGRAGLDNGYGMGWWVELDGDRLTDAGAYGSTPWLDLQDGYGAYLVIEADTLTGFDLSGQLFDVVEQAVVGR